MRHSADMLQKFHNKLVKNKVELNSDVHIPFVDRGALMGFELLPISWDDIDEVDPKFDMFEITSPERWIPMRYRESEGENDEFEDAVERSVDVVDTTNESEHVAVKDDSDKVEVFVTEEQEQEVVKSVDSEVDEYFDAVDDCFYDAEAYCDDYPEPVVIHDLSWDKDASELSDFK